MSISSLEAVLFSAQYSALKLIRHGTVNISLPAGLSNNGSATVSHGYGSDDLVYFVVGRDVSGNTDNNMILPFSTSAASLIAFANIDSSNLYIRVGTNSLFNPFPAITWQFEYWVFVP